MRYVFESIPRVPMMFFFFLCGAIFGISPKLGTLKRKKIIELITSYRTRTCKAPNCSEYAKKVFFKAFLELFI